MYLTSCTNPTWIFERVKDQRVGTVLISLGSSKCLCSAIWSSDGNLLDNRNPVQIELFTQTSLPVWPNCIGGPASLDHVWMRRVGKP